MLDSRATQGARVTVLLVEDDAEMRTLVKDYLETEGFDVFDQATGERAAALAACMSFDAAVVDKEMPGMNGLDLLSHLRSRWPAVPVIVMTAFGGPAVAEEALARGASDYLEKPFRIRTLAEALRALTARRPPTRSVD
jgi:DNA-binding response OmpR family regulator